MKQEIEHFIIATSLIIVICGVLCRLAYGIYMPTVPKVNVTEYEHNGCVYLITNRAMIPAISQPSTCSTGVK